jgi:hypothetical protein
MKKYIYILIISFTYCIYSHIFYYIKYRALNFFLVIYKYIKTSLEYIYIDFLPSVDSKEIGIFLLIPLTNFATIVNPIPAPRLFLNLVIVEE